MQIPFTLSEFLAVFRDYNDAIWPAQILLYIVGLTIVAVAARSTTPRASWYVVGGLSALWLWMGVVYHLTFFIVINPAAAVFGSAFLLQAVLLFVWPWRTPSLSFRAPPGIRLLIG